jgi:dihydropyrimidinase
MSDNETPAFDLVIRQGTVVNEDSIGVYDVGITGGRIVALGLELGPAVTDIDATGKLVLPGGVDSHCHIEQPKRAGPPNADTFASGTTSAAFGGTTCVICFAPQEKGEGISAAVADYHARAERGAVIDYSFHVIITDPTEAVLERELPPLVAAGHRSIKIFMTYEPSFLTDEQVLDVMAAARRLQALVVVHAENHAAIRWMTARLVRAGLTTPKYHAYAKPAVVEREAIHRVIALAELLDQPIQIFHVTTAEGVEEISRAQARGLKVYGETCPQYLGLTADDLARPGIEGAKMICSPALRTVADQEALWLALKIGVLGIVSSDHAPSRIGADGKQFAGVDAPFTKIPNGLPGLETRLPYLFSEGVRKGRIDLQRFVALTSTNPAKLFGLAPRKGRISIGADADIAIWDPDLVRTVHATEMHTGADYTPFEGMVLTGWPVSVFVRGRAVVLDGKNLAEPGSGEFVPRAPYREITPLGRFANDFNPHIDP